MTKDEAAAVRLVGDVPVRLWGLDLDDWQARAWTKAGARGVSEAGRLLAGADWVISPALQRALLARPGAALVVPDGLGDQTRVAAIHVPAGRNADDYLDLVNTPDPDLEALRGEGLTPGGMSDFVDEYDKALRKRETPYALSLLTQTPRAVEKRLFKGAYKGVTDLVTKYAWPWPAFHVTRACASLGLSPNLVTTGSLVFVILAFWLFWIGAWIPGLLAAWAMTFLDTVDGKLARTTMTYSRWGNVYDHGIDLIHPPFWYWAIYEGLTRTGTGTGSGPDWLAPALGVIVAGYVIGRIVEGIFMHTFGFHIHVWKRIDSWAREITARRNPNMLIFTVCVLLTVPAWGFLAVAAWTVIWIVFHTVRLVLALLAPKPLTSWMEG